MFTSSFQQQFSSVFPLDLILGYKVKKEEIVVDIVSESAMLT